MVGWSKLKWTRVSRMHDQMPSSEEASVPSKSRITVLIATGSAGVAEAGADAVDGGGDGAGGVGGVGFGISGGGAFAADEFDLEEAHGVDIGVAEADGGLEDGVGLEERFLLRDLEDHAVGQVELAFEGGEDAVAEGFVFDERGVEAGYAEVGFGEGHLDVADDVDEEGEVAHHGLKESEVGGSGDVGYGRILQTHLSAQRRAGRWGTRTGGASRHFSVT